MVSCFLQKRCCLIENQKNVIGNHLSSDVKLSRWIDEIKMLKPGVDVFQFFAQAMGYLINAFYIVETVIPIGCFGPTKRFRLYRI